MHSEELPNEGREPSLKVNFTIGRRRPLTLWDLIDDLRELADEGFGDHEPGISTIVLRPHVETESEKKARLLAEASAELRGERSGRRKKGEKP